MTVRCYRAIEVAPSSVPAQLTAFHTYMTHPIAGASASAPPSWPTLTNPQARQPIPHVVWEQLLVRQRKPWLKRDIWRTHRRFYALRRGTRSFLLGLYEEVASAPKKTVFDLLTGLPIALVVLPPFRERIFALPYSWQAYLLLVLARVGYGAWRRGAIRRSIRDEMGLALQRMLPIIECARIHVDAKSQKQSLPAIQLQRNIESILSALVDLAAQALQAPKGVRIGANLMLPMPVYVEGESTPRAGCGIVTYNAIPASPSWSRLVLGDLGAGRVFSTGKVQAIEDTKDPVWCGLLKGSRSRCFASFPVRNESAEVIAVVNIDADRPMILTRKNASAMFSEVLSPPLKLLGDLLLASSVTPPTGGQPR